MQPVSIYPCGRSGGRGLGGCCKATLQQKCKAAIRKWGQTSWFWVPWGREHRYLCPLGVPALMWWAQQCCTPPGNPKSHLLQVLLKLCSSLSFLLLVFFFFCLLLGQTLLPTCFLLANESKKEVWGRGTIIWTFLGL